MIHEDSEPWASFMVRYRPKVILQAQGILPVSPPSSPRATTPQVAHGIKRQREDGTEPPSDSPPTQRLRQGPPSEGAPGPSYEAHRDLELSVCQLEQDNMRLRRELEEAQRQLRQERTARNKLRPERSVVDLTDE